MDAQVFRERTGENPAWAVNAVPPDHSRIATIEHREGFLYIEPVLSGPCDTRLARPYADLREPCRRSAPTSAAPARSIGSERHPACRCRVRRAGAPDRHPTTGRYLHARPTNSTARYLGM